jgi:hypothetical protein
MNAWSKHRGLIVFGVFVLFYVSLHFATTSVKPMGGGGLSGPCQVRVYSSEYQLALFHPVYLVERWIRNRDLFYASYYFNCDFKDQFYANEWMYGDGNYGFVWYDNPTVLAIFWIATVCFTLGVWKLARFPFWASSVIGLLCAMLIAFSYFSHSYAKVWEIPAPQKHFIASVLWLKATDSQGSLSRGYRSSLHQYGNNRLLFETNNLSATLVSISSNGFSLVLRHERPGADDSVCHVDFSYGAVTKTNWNSYQIEGAFPWYKPDV